MATLLLLRFLLIWYFHVEILQSPINALLNYLAQRYCRIIYLVTIISIDYHKTIREQLLDDGVGDIDDEMAMLITLMMLVMMFISGRASRRWRSPRGSWLHC